MKTLRDLFLTHIPCGDQYTDDEWNQRMIRSVGNTSRDVENIHTQIDVLSQLWLQSGCPAVIVGHKLAASLACTSAAGLQEADFVLPWGCFYIHCPTELIPAGGESVTGILFVKNVGMPGYTLMLDEGMRRGYDHEGRPYSLPNISTTVAASLPDLARDFEPKIHPDDRHGIDAASTLLMATVRRLAVGIVLELAAPQYREQIVLGPPHKRPSKRRSDVPIVWNIKLTRDVVLDVRQGLRSYCLGTAGSSPTVQTLVRGHHKWQACGVGLSERKHIHIEPYWRGPEDAPIGVRSHVLPG